jgi:phosphonate transport system substrate-binding protein
MKPVRLVPLVALAGALTLAGGGSLQASEKLVVALKPDKNPEQMLAERRALAEYLQGAVGRPAEVIVPLSAAVILEGLANGTLDLAYLSASDMLNARRAQSADVLLAGEIGGRPEYRSYWVALADRPFAKVEDLRGRRVAFSSRTSTSGYVIPHADLVRKGLLEPGAGPEAFFGAGNVWYGSGYVSAVERVLSGEAEAAAISYYVLDEDKHLSVEQRRRLKKVAEQGPVPTHVLAVRRTLQGAPREALRRALLALNDPTRAGLRDRVFTSRLVAVDEAKHLAPLEEAQRLIGAR